MTRRMIAAALLAAALPAGAATPSQGKEALRNLAVSPHVEMSYGYNQTIRDGRRVFVAPQDLPSELRRLQSALKERPGDVRLKVELAEMLSGTDDTNAAHLAWLDVEKLWRQGQDANAADASALLQLGEAVENLGRDAEAESLYRRAVLGFSNDWRCWAGLGNFLQTRACGLLTPQGLGGISQPSLKTAPPELLDYHPRPDTLERGEAMLREAGQCLDRATTLAPKEPDAWVQHGFFASLSNYESRLIEHYKGEDQPRLDSAGLIRAFYCPAGLEDYRRAEELGRTNYALTATVCMFTIIERRCREPEVSPDSLQASVGKEVLLLEDLGRQPDRKAAVGALAALGWVQLSALKDMSGARASARAAVAEDPTQDSAWDILVALSVGEGSADELVEICENRLKHLDSTRNRLYLAKAYLRREQPEKAEEQASAILKIEPGNLAAYLVLAVADLKRSDKPQFLEAAGVAINQAVQVFKAAPPSAESSDRRREISLNLAIWAGLQDDPEYRKMAKAVVQDVLEHLPDDQTAKDILRALQ